MTVMLAGEHPWLPETSCKAQNLQGHGLGPGEAKRRDLWGTQGSSGMRHWFAKC